MTDALMPAHFINDQRPTTLPTGPEPAFSTNVNRELRIRQNRVAIRPLFPGHVLFFRVKNSVRADLI